MKSRWSVEQLRSLRDMEVTFPEGHICLLPIIQDFGRNIKWDARIYVKGAAGVLPVDRESLVSIGCPEAEADGWVAKTERAMTALRSLYPAMIPELEGRLKELEAAAPALLAGGR
ncbi:MAG: hypothetical protein DDT25_01005 [Chloroflexi bacterium]|nr:hypothetical protein [Chloroflexota bacterium]